MWNQQKEAWRMNALLQDSLKSSSLPPRPSPRGLVSMYYPLNLQQVQRHMLESSLILCFPNAATLGASVEQETCISSVPPASWTCRMETGFSITQAERLDWGHCCSPPRGIWFLSPWFHSLLMTFSKVPWAQNCFHNFICFCIKGLIFLFLKPEIVTVL